MDGVVEKTDIKLSQQAISLLKVFVASRSCEATFQMSDEKLALEFQNGTTKHIHVDDRRSVREDIMNLLSLGLLKKRVNTLGYPLYQNTSKGMAFVTLLE